MQESGAQLVGRHDFRALSSVPEERSLGLVLQVGGVGEVVVGWGRLSLTKSRSTRLDG